MIHAYSRYTPADPETRRRNSLAERSWRNQLWFELPIADDDCPQLWVEDGRRFPFVKGFFDKACFGLADDEIVVYTNSDIICRSDCSSMLAAFMQDTHACYCFRRDFHSRVDRLPTDDEFQRAVPYAGSDLYAFRVAWWNAVRHDFPELIFGFEAWDTCLRHLIRLTNPGRIEVKDLICHERHASRWEQPANRRTLPGQVHCLRESFKWLVAHGINPSQHGIVMP